MRKNKIELEELLKLKRAECPSDVDWARFDSELRGRLLKEAVANRSNFGALRGAFSVAAVAALFAMGVGVYFYSPIFFYDADGSEVVYSPLPNIKVSYAVNEFSVSGTSADPVWAQVETSATAISNAPAFYADSLSFLNGANF